MIRTKNSRVEPGEPADEELARRAVQGSFDAFNILYERYLPRVYNWVRCVVPETDVEDVTQETFLAMMKSLPGFRGTAKFSTWLRTLANRRVADYYRSRRGGQADEAQDLTESDHSVRPEMIAPDAAEDDTLMLRLAIARLPERYKDVVRLRFSEGLQFSEIAEISGLSLEATKSLFRRAIAALRSEIGEVNV